MLDFENTIFRFCVVEARVYVIKNGKRASVTGEGNKKRFNLYMVARNRG